MLTAVQSSPKFGAILMHQKFSINIVKGSGDETRYIPVTEDKFPSTFPSKLVIILHSKLFNQFKGTTDGEEALSYIGYLLKNVDYLLLSAVNAQRFPHEVDAAKFPLFKDAVKFAESKIEDKLELTNLSLVSEYTMRGFIDIVLDESVRVVLRYLRSINKYPKCLTVVSERQLVGFICHGPVDCSILLNGLDIVLTEAKKDDMNSGLVQNLLQQRASLEFLTNISIGRV